MRVGAGLWSGRIWWAASLALVLTGCAPGQQIAQLGDLPLQSGAVLRDCRVGYRTFGTLDAARSNAVLVTAWSMGRSRDLARHIGPGRLVDSRRYFVIAVDPLGNGVSSSPSNSLQQPGDRFPRLSIRDMVEAQRRLVRDVLHLEHLHAVVGTSLGGMQAFEWAVSDPGFVDRVVSIAGSPRATPAERERWRVWADGVARRSHWRRALGQLGSFDPVGALRQLDIDAGDYRSQAQAIVDHDVTARFGGSLEAAARAVRARLMVVVSPNDEVVDPAGALAFGRLAHAEILELQGTCGHGNPSCNKGTLWPAVERFLAR